MSDDAEHHEERFRHLASLPLGWDSYGADRIDPDCIDRARSVLTALRDPVSISGTVGGGIFLTWQDEHVTFEIDPGGRLAASVGESYASSDSSDLGQPATASTPAPDTGQARAGDRVQDGGQWGTLVRCHECGGGGLLHQLDEEEMARMRVEPKDELPPGTGEARDTDSILRTDDCTCSGTENPPLPAEMDPACTLHGLQPSQVTVQAPDADGSGPEEVWVPPSSDCMNHAHEPCPHCESTVFHHRTGRCGTCGRRPVQAPAYDDEEVRTWAELGDEFAGLGEVSDEALRHAYAAKPTSIDLYKVGRTEGYQIAAARIRHLIPRLGDPNAQPSPDTAPAPDVAALRSALRRVADVLDAADQEFDYVTAEIDTNTVRMALLDTEDAPPAELRRQIRTLLATPTEETERA